MCQCDVTAMFVRRPVLNGCCWRIRTAIATTIIIITTTAPITTTLTIFIIFTIATTAFAVVGLGWVEKNRDERR